MGSGLVLRLLETGHEVMVYDQSPTCCRGMEMRGAHPVASIAQMAQACEVILVMVTDDQAVCDVALGPDGILRAGGCCHTVIDSSTVLPDTSRRVAAELKRQGIDYLDAPVTGNPAQAQSGELMFLIGGEQDTIARCEPIFCALGRQHVHMGEHGAGSCAKLCCNLMGMVNLMGLCEALTMAEANGILPDRLLEVANLSGGRSAVSLSLGERMLSGHWDARFALKHAAKDARLAAQLARQGEGTSGLPGIVADRYAEAAAHYGTLDVTAVYRFYLEQARIRHTQDQAEQNHE
ncbi:MAG: NAD(P)-dependent oxidoreductase [Phycisphaeraceae bacterium]|nr:NAD(P)-dependent oxidoreductase [Phycisphaeraceae bacterium]